MIPIPSSVRVWIATGHTDMRRGMQSLALAVQESLKRDPHAGDLYIFRGRRGDLVKILWHDGLGMSSMPSGWTAASSFGLRRRTVRYRSHWRRWLTCSRASIGGIRNSAGGRKARAEQINLRPSVLGSHNASDL